MRTIREVMSETGKGVHSEIFADNYVAGKRSLRYELIIPSGVKEGDIIESIAGTGATAVIPAGVSEGDAIVIVAAAGDEDEPSIAPSSASSVPPLSPASSIIDAVPQTSPSIPRSVGAAPKTIERVPKEKVVYHASLKPMTTGCDCFGREF